MAFIFHYFMIAIEDQHGHGWAEVVNEMGDTVQVSGLQDSQGRNAWFESEAYHLRSWCQERGLFYYVKEVSEDVTFDE